MRPVVFVGGSVLAFLFPRLWAITFFGASSQIVENSFYRSGYEILFTPLPKHKKRPTKTMIDVGVEKGGMAIGSIFVFVVIAILPKAADQIILGFTMAAGIVGFFVCTRLHKGYVKALADSLRTGAIALENSDVVDKTTMFTLSQTIAGPEHQELMRGIAAYRAQEKGKREAIKEDRSLEVIQALRSGNSGQIMGALENLDGKEPVVISHLIALLEDDRYVEPVVEKLGPMVERCVGQLIDTLLDTTVSEPLRRRIPRLVAMARSKRAVLGLCVGLGDVVFDVRYRCCLALNKILEVDKELTVDKKTIFSFVHQETQAEDSTSVSKRLEHIKNLLCLVTDSEATRIGFRALQSQNANMKGTGKEYLKNVVSNELYLALIPLFNR